jgi:hypothetical protein
MLPNRSAEDSEISSVNTSTVGSRQIPTGGPAVTFFDVCFRLTSLSESRKGSGLISTP